jgi:hypothetical protein
LLEVDDEDVVDAGERLGKGDVNGVLLDVIISIGT